jgi:hypothetical protein
MVSGYGDIFLPNSAWGSSIQKKYSPAGEALDFGAMSKKLMAAFYCLALHF